MHDLASILALRELDVEEEPAGCVWVCGPDLFIPLLGRNPLRAIRGPLCRTVAEARDWLDTHVLSEPLLIEA